MKKRRFFRFYQIGFFVLLLLLAYMLYENYNYIVFKLLIADNYIFTDTLDTWYKETLGEENVKGYHRNFDDVVIAAVTDKIRSLNDDRYTYLYTPQHYQLTHEMEKADAATARFEQLSPDTVYMILPNISSGTRDFVLNSKEQLKPYKNLVLDLRSNYGGFLPDLYTIAELFVNNGDTIGHEKTRLPFLTHAIRSGQQPTFSFEHIAVLQDGNTASAAEGLILALKENLTESVTLIGQKTFGKGIGQVTLPLRDGFAVKATVLLVSGPSDTSIHRIGIEPDIFYDAEDIIQFAHQTIES